MTTNDIWNDDEFNESEVVYSPISRATYIFNEFMKGITDRRRSYSRIPGRITPVLALINELNGPFKRYPDPGRLATAEMVIFIHKLLSYLDRSARHRNNFRTARAVLILHDKFTRRDFNFKLDFTLRSEYLTNVNYWRNLKKSTSDVHYSALLPPPLWKDSFYLKTMRKARKFLGYAETRMYKLGGGREVEPLREIFRVWRNCFNYLLYFGDRSRSDFIHIGEPFYIGGQSSKKIKKIKMNKNLPQKKQKINVIRYLV